MSRDRSFIWKERTSARLACAANALTSDEAEKAKRSLRVTSSARFCSILVKAFGECCDVPPVSEDWLRPKENTVALLHGA